MNVMTTIETVDMLADLTHSDRLCKLSTALHLIYELGIHPKFLHKISYTEEGYLYWCHRKFKVSDSLLKRLNALKDTSFRGYDADKEMLNTFKENFVKSKLIWRYSLQQETPKQFMIKTTKLQDEIDRLIRMGFTDLIMLFAIRFRDWPNRLQVYTFLQDLDDTNKFESLRAVNYLYEINGKELPYPACI